MRAAAPLERRRLGRQRGGVGAGRGAGPQALAAYAGRGPRRLGLLPSLRPRRAGARRLYEELYCARGEMENRIKEQQLGLFADRTSSATLRGNQLRLLFSAFACVLMHGLRRLGLAGTACARAQCATTRLKLLKVGARVRVSVRKVRLSISEAWPHAALFEKVANNLRTHPPWPRSFPMTGLLKKSWPCDLMNVYPLARDGSSPR